MAAPSAAAGRRYQIWSVDIRSIEGHGLDTGKPVSTIVMLENDSRTMLARLLALRQDPTASPVVLRRALRRPGDPSARSDRLVGYVVSSDA